MAASNTSGPDEPSVLSVREKKILEGIEDDILTVDRILARRMMRSARPKPGSRWWATARHGALLLAALIILMMEICRPVRGLGALPSLARFARRIWAASGWLLLAAAP